MRRFSTYYAATFSGLALCGMMGCSAQPGRVQTSAKKTDDTPRNVRPEATPQLNAASLFAYGHLQERQGAYESAVTQYRKALDAKPDLVTARNRLGITLNKLGRHSEAAVEFKKAIRTNPNDAFLHNNLGFTLLLQGQYAEAEQSLRQALTLKNDFQRARMNLGLALAKQERFAEAETELRHACGDADAMFNMGVLMTEAHRYDDAVHYMEQALEINPQLEAARRQLTELARLASHDSVTGVTTVAVPTPATLVPATMTGIETTNSTTITPTGSAAPGRGTSTGTTVKTGAGTDSAKHSTTPAVTPTVRSHETETSRKSTADSLDLLAYETHSNVSGLRMGESGPHALRIPEVAPNREQDPSVVMAKTLLRLARQESDGQSKDGHSEDRDAEIRILLTQVFDALEADSVGIEDLLCKIEDQIFPGLRGSPCNE